MQYFRQAKNWLLEQFPHHRAAVDKNLIKKRHTLERHCIKRVSGQFVSKAPACTKSDLKDIMEKVYSTAFTCTDYQDAALLRQLWFLFGRVSGLTMLLKANLSVGSGDILFVLLSASRLRDNKVFRSSLSKSPPRVLCLPLQ